MIYTNPVNLTVVNPAITEGPQGVIYQGVSASLSLTLTNNSGGTINMNSSPNAAEFQIFFPEFFAASELQALKLTPPQNWNCVYDSGLMSFNVTYTGSSSYAWSNGDTFLFACASVETASQPASGGCGLQINTSNMTGNMPSEIPATLSVLTPPVKGNLNLPTVLQVSLDTQGSVYVSPSKADPLPNTLFLTFTNIGPGNLFTGSKPWATQPTVTVSFIYGNSAGALAPNDGSNVGSAWSIIPGISASQGNNWQAKGPTPTGKDNDPVWTVTPLDQDILQTGASASISFSFTGIVSITAIGHTQMTVQFSGFPANDTQSYNNCVYVLDIVKLPAPLTRGLLNFYGDVPVISVAGPNQPITIGLNWLMFYVDSVSLVCSFPGIPAVPFSYPNQTGLSHQSTPVTIPSVTYSTPIFFTMQGFDGSGKFLNALQYTVWVNSGAFIDPRDNKVYPTVLIDGLYWMTENLDWNAPGSVPYGNLATNEQIYGRLYPFAQAEQVPPQPTPPPPPPPPWRLPSVADWNNLIGAAGMNPYTALMQGGTTGFNALLSGECDNNSNFSGLHSYGYYWSSDQVSSQVSICKFSSVSSSVNTVNQLPANFLVSVRYVRNA